jgi:transposase-like protein
MTVNTKKINPQLIDELIKDCKTPEDFLGESGVIKTFVKSIFERALNAELSTHLGYEKYDPEGKNSGNSRNGSSSKTLKGDFGAVQLEVPRDRNGSFEPELIQKNQTRFEGFDGKIISLYARGMSTRDIQAQIQELYGVELSPALISSVTEGVLEEVKAWQSRSLDGVYPIVYLDALVIKIKENKQVINKAIYLALGINCQGSKEVLGMWVSQNEGAKFWLSILTELRNRGLQDIFICCVDGLTGFPEAIEAVYPKTTVQLCIVHMIRNSLRYVSYKDRKAVVSDLKPIYRALTLDAAESALTAFGEKWDSQYPAISRLWFAHWEKIIPFFGYPPEIRKAVYTTNAIESLNMTFRKVLKNKRFFPSDDAAFKQLYLALQNISKKWTMPIRDWGMAMNRFMIQFGDRVPAF